MSNPTPPWRRASTMQPDAQLPAQQPAHPTAQRAPQPYLPPYGCLSLGQVYGPQPAMPQVALPQPAMSQPAMPPLTHRRYDFTAGYSGNPSHLYGDPADVRNPAYYMQNAQYESPMMSAADRRVIDNDPRYGLGGVPGNFGYNGFVPEKNSAFGHDAAFDIVNRTGRMAQDQLDYFLRRNHAEAMLEHRHGPTSETVGRLTPMPTARMPQNTEPGTTAAAARGNSTGQYRFTAANLATDSDKQLPSLTEQLSRPAHRHIVGRQRPVKIDSPTDDLLPEKANTLGKESSDHKGEQFGKTLANKAQKGVQTTSPSHHSAPQEVSMHMEETYSDLQKELVATRNLLSTVKEQLALTKVANGAREGHHGRALHQAYGPSAHGTYTGHGITEADRITAGIENLKEYKKVMAARNHAQQTQGKDEAICKADKVPFTVPDKSPRWTKAGSNAEIFYDGFSTDSDSSASGFSSTYTPVVTPRANKVVPDNKPAYFHGIPTGGMKKYASSHAVKPATKPAPVVMSQSDRDNISLQMEKLMRAQAIKPATKTAPANPSHPNDDHISMLMKKLAGDKADQPAHPKSSTASTTAPASHSTPPATDTPFEDIAFAIHKDSFSDIVVSALGDMGCDNLAEFWALPDREAYREEQFVLIEAVMLEIMYSLRHHYIEGEADKREKIKKALQWLLKAAGVKGAVPCE